MTELDDILLEVIRPRVEAGMQFLVLLTKADKLNRSEGAKALSIARLQAGGGQVRLFSALKRQGVEEAALLLSQWVANWTPPANIGADLSGGLGADVGTDLDADPESTDGGHR
jgi:GTP-binding protein